MNVDIENLSLEELVELHLKICKRIRELNRAKLSEKLGNFEVGDKVYFKHEADTLTGTVIRVNKKSLSIRTEKGLWRVDPRLVTKISLSLETSNGRIQQLPETTTNEK